MKRRTFLQLIASTAAAAAQWQPVKNAADWPKRRAAILAAAQEIMGPLPGAEKRCALDVQVSEEVDCGSHVRRLITYASEPGSRTPAYLLIPKTALAGKAAPAALCLHGTNNDIGHAVVIEGLGNKTPNRQYASELADRGFVTLAPNYPLLAKYQPEIFKLGYASGTMKAIWDNVRGLDLFDSMPEVKHGAYGAIGHSLGGHNSVYTAVFDERIKAVVTSCGLDSYRDYMDGDPKRWAHGQGWCQDRYMPRLAKYQGRLDEIPFDFDGLLAAIAPRRVFISAPLKDSNFRWQSVDRVVASAREVYALLGAPDGITVEHPDCPHDFPEDVRKRAYAFLEKTLA
ncbi:MAG: dienelactone hydrolase family protein [Chthoniobacteraceae bacterium]